METDQVYLQTITHNHKWQIRVVDVFRVKSYEGTKQMRNQFATEEL